MALANDIFVASSELDAYLIISAVSIVVTILLPSMDLWRSSKISLAVLLSAPITILSGFKVSARAVPSRKNSGQDAMSKDIPLGITCLTIFSTWQLVPTGR